MIERLEN